MNQINLFKWMIYAGGILIMSFGIALTIWAAILGVSPWDSFHLGLTYISPFNYGQISQFVGAVAILIGMILGVKPKIGTVLNMIIVGWLINRFLELLPDILHEINALSLAVFLIGVILNGVGTALYISADKGIGPRDSMMMGVNKRFGIRIGLARTILEVLVVTLGFLLSGPIGIGTILFSLTIGFFVDKSFNILRKIPVFEALYQEKGAAVNN